MPREHRILITGASGFVGSWLQRELDKRRLEQGSDLIVLTAGQGDVSDWKTDITDRDQVTTLIRNCRPTAIIHLAAIAAPADARKMPQRAWNVNFQGTMNLAYAAMELAPESRFIFVGSSEAYGASFIDAANAPIKESAALKPMNVYGATKAAADILVGQLAHDGLKSVRFRPFNHTGPGQTDAYVVSAFAKQLAEISVGAKPPRISVGNLSAFRDFLDVRDVVRAYADAALIDDVSDMLGGVFNLSSGRSVQIQSILDMLIELCRLKVEIEIDPQRLRGPEIAAASGDNKAALSAFGWKPEIELSRTLDDVLHDWKIRVAR
ncbi:NAD-dependent epimerase/dehydratase family protein [Agrobacterium rhizogenes]|uniref:GDP-mannose 4,6-dehydratase n=1 Tax=Rhizobium rhizogenes TaxID=359 RepID=UPI00123B2796|nr:GDP-mannose 4,6-dehydratase [Rhizobium rhizogenes]KAA6482872.1 NAD-dependent epimerase/dehydratase family protein [Agrobacterium sp. ICMP 7243]NTG15686.1 NAD-dependent epimerase/dehydratase family protein [Rhizobium rhizogenes]NTG22620.1 NAD-dependent epimerase/dehydratase family protein [Rhizobium rhizogenes]NTI04069.1 NAD-dependent epimerase/dehydratase family protein [Rhizobium rhizogenes]NTI10878.1 NAD-dependent epimerase/dehydratase family protein [Rhizobium rhizogenes]